MLFDRRAPAETLFFGKNQNKVFFFFPCVRKNFVFSGGKRLYFFSVYCYYSKVNSGILRFCQRIPAPNSETHRAAGRFAGALACSRPVPTLPRQLRTGDRPLLLSPFCPPSMGRSPLSLFDPPQERRRTGFLRVPMDRSPDYGRGPCFCVPGFLTVIFCLPPQVPRGPSAE